MLLCYLQVAIIERFKYKYPYIVAKALIQHRTWNRAGNGQFQVFIHPLKAWEPGPHGPDLLAHNHLFSSAKAFGLWSGFFLHVNVSVVISIDK